MSRKLRALAILNAPTPAKLVGFFSVLDGGYLIIEPLCKGPGLPVAYCNRLLFMPDGPDWRYDRSCPGPKSFFQPPLWQP